MSELRDKISPPRWATRFLHWYCKPELVEDLEGDLNEYFQRNVKNRNARRAKLIYIIDVFKFFRLYTIRKPEFVNLLINWIMLASYIKTSSRNIARNPLFSAINIIGLAISMSVGLLMISILSDTASYDKFHANHKNIYRLISQYQYLDDKGNNFMATSSMKAAKLIRETFSQPQQMTVLHRGFGGDMKVGEKTIPLSGFWADESFFKVFSFPLVSGNPDKILKEPFSVVLTENAAYKFFGDQDPIGKIITYNEKQYTVTGVMQDVPQFSHMRFEMLGSLSTWEIFQKDSKSEMAWDNVWNYWTYLQLPPDVDMKNFKANLDELSKKEDPSVKNTHIELDLQPLDEIVTGANLGNQIGPSMGSSALWIFGALSFIVILSACFNYTNLSIARSLKRTREVGIRKVIGALKGHVISQFVTEAILISLGSLVFAFLLFLLLRPYFLGIEPDIQKILTLELSFKVVLYFIGLAVFVGVAAGLFPALFFSKVNAVQVLKDASSSRLFKKLTMRKVLIVFQYCISIMFITSTFIAYKQYRHFVNFDLGFSTSNILNIQLAGNKPELLKKELLELPEVKGISHSQLIMSIGNYWGTNMKYHASPNDSAGVYYNIVDENYLALHELKLLAGKNFNVKPDSAEESEVIVNEAVLKRFNIGGRDPFKAIDDIIKLDGKDLQIIGVMKDFEYGRANNHNQQKEVVLRYSPKNVDFLNVKIQSNDLIATYDKIEAIWKKLDSVHPLEAKFYDDQIEQGFSGLKASIKVAGFLSFLTICIATLGLLGMVVFTTETRLKEISIRKVLGADEAGLLYLLSKGFFILLSIATLIALPITYLLFDQLLFPELANHASIGIGDMLWGVMMILGIALVMIGSQTLKVARTNPAQVLKSE